MRAYACSAVPASVTAKLYFTDVDSGTIQLIDSQSVSFGDSNTDCTADTDACTADRRLYLRHACNTDACTADTDACTADADACTADADACTADADTCTSAATPPPPPPPPPPIATPETVTDVEFRRAAPDHLPFAIWLLWTHIPNTRTYVVERSVTSPNDSWDVVSAVTAPDRSESVRSTFSNNYLAECGVNNKFRVAVAENATGVIREEDREFSDHINVHLPCTAPGPRQLRARYSTKTSFSLSWNAVPDASAYKVERRRASSTYWESAHSGISEISGSPYTTTGLDCDTDYYFRVRARGDGYPYTLRFGEPSVEEGPEDTDDCGTNPPPPPPPPTSCQIDLGTLGGAAAFSRRMSCDFSAQDDTDFEFDLEGGWHVSADLILPDGTEGDVELAMRKAIGFTITNPISRDVILIEDHMGNDAEYFNPDSTGYAFRVAAILEDTLGETNESYKVKVSTPNNNVSRKGTLRIYGEQVIPPIGHQEDYTVQFTIDRLPPTRTPDDSTTNANGSRPSLPSQDPGTLFPQSIATATAEWNRAVATPWPHLLFCESPPQYASWDTSVTATPVSCPEDRLPGDGFTTRIKVMSGEYAPGFGRIPFPNLSGDCGPDIGCIDYVSTSNRSVQDGCANLTYAKHAIFVNLEDPDILGRCHIEDRILRLEEPAWLFSSPSGDSDAAPKVHIRIFWTDDWRSAGTCPDPQEPSYCYRYLPAIVMHEMGHAAGLTDLYLGVFKGTWLDNGSYLMHSPGGKRESPDFDIMYVNQVYRNEHGSSAHVSDDS